LNPKVTCRETTVGIINQSSLSFSRVDQEKFHSIGGTIVEHPVVVSSDSYQTGSFQVDSTWVSQVYDCVTNAWFLKKEECIE
jgi:hypothetical protein